VNQHTTIVSLILLILIHFISEAITSLQRDLTDARESWRRSQEEIALLLKNQDEMKQKLFDVNKLLDDSSISNGLIHDDS
jgi:hypothetical protein